jgi:hypothetical protein
MTRSEETRVLVEARGLGGIDHDEGSGGMWDDVTSVDTEDEMRGWMFWKG